MRARVVSPLIPLIAASALLGLLEGSTKVRLGNDFTMQNYAKV